MFRSFVAALIIVSIPLGAMAQQATMQSDVQADVLDYTSIDSLWRESIDRGRLRTDGVSSHAYIRFRVQCEHVAPMSFLPNARLAFWTNVYLVCLMEAMHLRIGYRATATDSLWLRRDTFFIANERLTLEGVRDKVRSTQVLVHAYECLPTGSSQGAPFPTTLASGRRIRVWYRDLFRRIIRSERHIMFDPWSTTLQASMWMRPLWQHLGERDATFIDYIMPYMTEAMAAQVALGAPRLRVQFTDRIETWRKARPR